VNPLLSQIDQVQIALLGLSFTVAITMLGIIVKGTWWLKSQFESLKFYLENLLDQHEQKDQQRHEDNLQKMTIMETKLGIIIKENGKSH